MRDEGVIYVAGHPLLNRRCTTRLPGCIRLRNGLYCVGWDVKLYILTHSLRILSICVTSGGRAIQQAGAHIPHRFLGVGRGHAHLKNWSVENSPFPSVQFGTLNVRFQHYRGSTNVGGGSLFGKKLWGPPTGSKIKGQMTVCCSLFVIQFQCQFCIQQCILVRSLRCFLIFTNRQIRRHKIFDTHVWGP